MDIINKLLSHYVLTTFIMVNIMYKGKMGKDNKRKIKTKLSNGIVHLSRRAFPGVTLVYGLNAWENM